MILPPDFFEAINGILGVMFLCVAFWFAYDIFTVYRWYGPGRRFYEEAAASIGCLILFVGEFIIRMTVWWIRYESNNNGVVPKEHQQIAWMIVSLGVIISIIGCACIIRHLAPDHLGRWPWLLAVVMALAFGVGMTF